MKEDYKNKSMAGSKSVKTKNQRFFFPDNPPVSIEATSREEAEKKRKKLLDNKDKNND